MDNMLTRRVTVNERMALEVMKRAIRAKHEDEREVLISTALNYLMEDRDCEEES